MGGGQRGGEGEGGRGGVGEIEGKRRPWGSPRMLEVGKGGVEEGLGSERPEAGMDSFGELGVP